MGSPAITLEQVLAITYFSAHAWAPDGRRIGYILDDGGRYSLRVVDVRTAQSLEISRGDLPVTAFDWAPDGRLAYLQGGRLLTAGQGEAPSDDGWRPSVLYAGPDPVTAVQWSPAPPALAFVTGGRLWLWDPAEPSLRHLDVGGRVQGLDHQPTLSWAPDGSAIAVTFRDDRGRWDLAVTDSLGHVLWRSETENLEGPFTWLRPGRLIFARPSVAYTAREWCVLDLPDGTVRVLHREDEPEGLGAPFAAQPHPDGRQALLVLRHEGWWHLYLLDTEDGRLRVLTEGTGEDVGHAYDLPRISPDGREAVFSTNRENLGMRHLFCVDLGSGVLRRLVDTPGTSVEAAWSPDGRLVAFRHSTVHHAPELWVVGRDGAGLRRLVGSMPEGVAPSRFALPQPAKTPGAGGLEIPGYLLVPPDLEPGRRYPALLYIHGGGMRQMREGFPPLKAYAFFYAVSLWLAERGVVSYLINYRGGIGYGKAFEQGNSGGLAVVECEDCVRAGEWLKTLPFVDPQRVGVWGLSYGGWLTLAALVRSPQTFALGINIAGIWDFDRWMAWAREAFRPAYDYFLGRARGSREQSPEVWRNASPRHLVAELRAPLINLHGTKDEAVPFEQLNLIVKDCVEHGKVFEAHYYPEETHLFTRRTTWRDALRKVEGALQRYLGYTPEDAPAVIRG
ncbi:MAG: prolyl oligopeptidase family serine peptidase [Armatimonadota bacterium]|nr:prolyl oligopeptidase family serine peptidase [Armatimonadota bacterium]MDR7450646.1 prolyl oligopeptidase family serine peptidase [Armatimonadota bacterium]MDR7466221.1 prolyl oligopeptidase family serine peptidase [Armatimonadota bacterium]MDR7492942.1 prolyl oligopeptidase family serine peptidase [Armatimonadota bacterium]MDR7498301.1 prolyl oligopeptidase family serine peptidase [Armatimonadota bacterium]